MLTLVAIVILGWGMAVFATQNTTLVEIGLAGDKFPVPVYGVVLGSLLIGMVLAGGLGLVNSVSSWLTMYGKENKLKEAQREIEELTEKVRQLETGAGKGRAGARKKGVDEETGEVV